MPAAVVVLAAGSGSRVGAEVNKVLLPLAGRPLVAWSLAAALATPDVAQVVLVCRPGEEDEIGAAVTPYLGEREVLLTAGGATRHQSERAALQVLRSSIVSGEIDVVAIHDGARPLAPAKLFDGVIGVARADGGAVPTVALPGLVAREAGLAAPGDLVGVQTPQAFRAGDLLTAYDAAAREGFEGTDTAACLERYVDLRIRGVAGDPGNLKVTWPEDLPAAEELLGSGQRGQDAEVLG